MKKTINWMPSDNDSRAVLAAIFNEFLQRNRNTQIIPSDIPTSTTYDPIPEKVKTCGTLEVEGIQSIDKIKEMHKMIHSQKRALKWNGGLSYQWPTLTSFRIYVAQDASGYRATFPIFYDDASDVDAILAVASGPAHQSIFQKIGVSSANMMVSTFTYDSNSNAWTER